MLIANAISTTQWTDGNAFVLVIANMSGNADASIWCCTNAIGTIVRTNWIATSEDMNIAFVALTTDLDFAHIGCGAIAGGHYIRSAAYYGGSSEMEKVFKNQI